MTNSTNKPTTVFWVIGIVALIWNIMGVMAYLAQAYMTDEALAAIPEAQRPLYENLPAWVTGAFAIAVFGGTLGSILLLFRKSAAYYLFIFSLLGVLVTMVYTLGVQFDFSLSEILGLIIMPIFASLFFIWYSKLSESKGWIS